MVVFDIVLTVFGKLEQTYLYRLTLTCRKAIKNYITSQFI